MHHGSFFARSPRTLLRSAHPSLLLAHLRTALLARSKTPSLGPRPTAPLEDSLYMPFVADWHGPRKLGPPHFVRSMPPAGFIRRTSYSSCASLLVARAVAHSASCRRVAGHPAPPDLGPPVARARHPAEEFGGHRGRRVRLKTEHKT